ncbi:MAG: hypothetical protein ACKO2D_14350 [Chloroflexota bacterium]
MADPTTTQTDPNRARRAAWASFGTAVAFWVVAWFVPEIREFAIVAGLCFFFLIGGVISWDSRGGH